MEAARLGEMHRIQPLRHEPQERQLPQYNNNFLHDDDDGGNATMTRPQHSGAPPPPLDRTLHGVHRDHQEINTKAYKEPCHTTQPTPTTRTAKYLRPPRGAAPDEPQHITMMDLARFIMSQTATSRPPYIRTKPKCSRQWDGYEKDRRTSRQVSTR